MAPIPFLGRSSAGGEADDDLDLPSHAAARGRSYLLSLATATAPAGELDRAGMGMGKSTSMLEIGAVRDMVEFGAAMEALELEGSVEDGEGSSRPPPKNKDKDDEGFFIDTSDHPEDEDGDDGDGFLRLSSSPDSVVAGPPPPGEAPSSRGAGGMRRVVSAVSLSGRQRRRGSLSAALRDGIPTISEEDHVHDEGRKRAGSRCVLDDKDQNGTESPKKSDLEGAEGPKSKADAPGDPTPSEGDISPSNLASSQASSDATVGTNDHRLDRRRSSASSAGGRGMPLRSSLKGSRNSLLSRTSGHGLADSEHSLDGSRRGSMTRNVSFSSLEIRSYPVTLGDALPSSTAAPPVSLDWDHIPSRTESHDVDDYERYRSDEFPRRVGRDMIMPPGHRRYLLMREAGLTRGEIRSAVEEARRTARNRARTERGLRMGLGPVEEALERTRRRLSLSRRGRRG